ncbi:hypothetical protein DBZ36_01170 [Alginatibacterium sediminis]|uniref:Zorya protein ZorC EH domain-containing protein n=1 Tax=Alginatibacterium sediminis TaxID=2164068 RepID=A0A420ENJ6_9ALTE|nr:EH signature domain-containing protein [Alginatibacterium sediminis]RKF22287.1 hypothetical protein DBZ36_01170 [Alginatibacterium sediminis]
MSFKDTVLDMPTLQTRTSLNISDSRLVEQAFKLRNRYGFVISEPPSSINIGHVHDKLKQYLQAHSSIFNFSRKEWRIVPWAFMLSINGNPPLYENEDYIQLLFERIKSKFDTTSPLIQVFLQEYPLGSRWFDLLRNAIHDFVTDSPDIKAITIKQWIDNTQILEKNSHEICAGNIRNAGFQSTFSSFKLTRGLEHSAFASESISYLLADLKSTLSTLDIHAQSQLVSSCLSFFITAEDSLKYPALRVNIADGLLSSFADNHIIPHIKKLLTDFFLNHYNDPRTSAVMWIGVTPTALSVIKSWLVENTMHDFFNLLSHIAKTDPMADKHWKSRKRFWNAYLKKGYIQEAWVALGSSAYSEARNFLQGGRSTYASLSGGQPRHSALIMVINGVLITEWSHSGSFRIWDTSLQRPKLYLSSYRRGNLVNGSDHTGSHSGSERGLWQQRLSSLIHDLTGVSIPRREYMND